jgi:hypothetical protein
MNPYRTRYCTRSSCPNVNADVTLSGRVVEVSVNDNDNGNGSGNATINNDPH